MSRERDRQRDRNGSKSSRNHDYLIKLRGISNSTNKDDIQDQRKVLLRKFVETVSIISRSV